MKMKGTFGFLMLIFTALMLLTVIGGMSTIFTSIASTWTTNQTAKIVDGIAQVLWYFGIVFVSVSVLSCITLPAVVVVVADNHRTHENHNTRSLMDCRHLHSRKC